MKCVCTVCLSAVAVQNYDFQTIDMYIHANLAYFALILSLELGIFVLRQLNPTSTTWKLNFGNYNWQFSFNCYVVYG